MRRSVIGLLALATAAWLATATPTGAGGQGDQDFGVRFTRYAVTDIGTLGGPTSEAWGINNLGQVVGRAALAPDSGGNVFYHAFLYDDGVMTDLGVIGPGCNPPTTNSWAFDINDSGQIVGLTCAAGLPQRAFLRSGGVMIDLGTLGGTASSARGINSAGDVVGTASTPSDGTTRAFLYRGGMMQDLGTLTGTGASHAYHINDSGTIVGQSTVPPGNLFHPFLYSNATMTDLTPGASCCGAAWGINNAGTVVGIAAGHDRAFVYRNGVLTYLGTLAGGATWAQSINNLEQIVGFSALGYNYWHAFLYEAGMMVDLNDHIPDNPEWDLNYTTAVNDVGQIVGIGTLGGQTRAYLLTPVPTAPTAVDDAYTTPYQVTLTVPAPGVLANDYGAGMSAMQAALVTSVSHGTLALNADGSFTYSPAPGYAGPDSFAYRATNAIGASNLATVSLTVTQPTNLQPPTELYVYSIVGNVVTLRWAPPLAGPRPTSYSVEGGINPGDVLAAFPTGSADPIFAFPAPAGSFTVRVHSVAGAARSAASNEIPLHVRAAVAPSAPASLTGVVNGSTVHLAWRNTFGGGAPTAVYLEASTGSAPMYIPLGLTETFSAGGVPAGIYTLRLRAANADGVSGPSNSLVVTVPGACSGPPEPPSNVLAYGIGRTIVVIWDPPTTGPAAVSYELSVGGAYVGSFPTSGRMLSGTVGPGSYELRLVARNPCGPSPPTPTQTVTVQ